jgi:hypothetical protein
LLSADFTELEVMEEIIFSKRGGDPQPLHWRDAYGSLY